MKFLSEECKVKLIKRAKTFGWNMFHIFAIAGLNFIAENLGLLDIHPLAIVFIAQLTAQATKYLNTK